MTQKVESQLTRFPPRGTKQKGKANTLTISVCNDYFLPSGTRASAQPKWKEKLECLKKTKILHQER